MVSNPPQNISEKPLLYWVDLEMTGLNVNQEVIIEVAALVTDINFREYAQFESVVKQPQSYLDNMDDWNKKHHSESGLLAKIPHGLEPALVEEKLMAIADEWFKSPQQKPILAGNSIAQDRLFIDRYFKNFSKKLHYRMLDVTSWKIVFQNKFQKEYKKKNSHRALDDIRESIEELKFYTQFMQL